MPEVDSPFTIVTIFNWFFLLACTVFLLYLLALSFHWFKYGTSKLINLFGVITFTSVSGILLAIMAGALLYM
tara:strand:- start:2757 stop:2972 length:216 start_codon:yes stop_codon:yes gene_type:complete